MRRYIITCEFHRPKRASAFHRHVQDFVLEWQHPHAGLWLVTSELSAGELRSELMAHVDYRDRLFICEMGAERTAFNLLPASGGRAIQLSKPRARSQSLLTSIFSRDGQVSRHLKAASAESWQSI